MGLTSRLTTSDRLSFFAWNIHGITSKSLGNKLQSTDFLDIINGSDFIILTETWKCSNVDVTGYRSIIQDGVMSKNGGRNSGGIILLYKNVFHDWISFVKTSPNFLWFKFNKHYTKTTEDIYVCGLYVPPTTSNYFDPEIFEELEKDILNFSSKGSILLLGDFNSRTGKYSDSVCHEGHNIITNDQSDSSFRPSQRNSYDNELNSHGKRLLDICKSADLKILNGRVSGDTLGRPTFHGRNGISVIDYAICDQDLFFNVSNFVVKQPCSLSDHSPIVTWININTSVPEINSSHENNTLSRLPMQFLWENDSAKKFKDILRSPDLQMLIRDYSEDVIPNEDVNTSLGKVENMLISAAKRCLKIRIRKNRKKMKPLSNKKWFDKECRFKKHELRKISNLKHRDPLNANLREQYHDTLTEYKKLLNKKN